MVRSAYAGEFDSGSAPIFTLMSRVEGDQRWGLGVIPHTRFKDGWGPSRAGNYSNRRCSRAEGLPALSCSLRQRS
jgi:hypothetical protein